MGRILIIWSCVAKDLKRSEVHVARFHIATGYSYIQVDLVVWSKEVVYLTDASVVVEFLKLLWGLYITRYAVHLEFWRRYDVITLN